ncbi:MAG: putative baseplate assembly protein [Nitriliruptorales bacterium]|nr:putative baseplate assembly protein [Nitriliruptorales bacterium]
MALPAPDLDDRRFQQLVDDAKRMVQQRCPEWTDHNVSDPGVTLIESFAFMVDQLVYRLNRVPDRNYVKFLELMGVTLFPPVAARADVTFWLSAAQADTVPVPVGTEVATLRTSAQEAVVFQVTEERQIVACEVEQVGSFTEPNDYRDHSAELEARQPFACFDNPPKPDDVLMIGLSQAVPGCAVLLNLDCHIEGVGVDPRFPPLSWEAWTGESWAPCELERDTTGGLNRGGEVVVHVPRGHTVSVISRLRAGWLRCRVIPPLADQPFYAASPTVSAVSAVTIGGTTAATHAELVFDEIIGLSEGVPGQRFSLRRSPVVPTSQPTTVQVAGGSGWDEWTSVPSFADSHPDDRHFMLEASAGEVLFGPAVRLRDGTIRQYGAVPPKGAPIRIPSYRTGGGKRGNVKSKEISVLKSSMPYVSSVVNRRAASGGVDGETLDNAKVRGPIAMRTRNRAVTVEDYEELAREAAPEIARVRCAPAGSEGVEAGAVRVLVVPAVEQDGRLQFEQLIPHDDTLRRIAEHLDARRLIGARVLVEPPVYQGVTVVARVRARPRTSAATVQEAALDALYRYFDPMVGGAEGRGWPFGRAVHVGEVYSCLQRVPGTEFVEDALLFAADPVSGQRGEKADRIELSEHALVFSFEHSVIVEES